MGAQRFPLPLDIGRRIAVVGATGSGKTAFARRLAGSIGVDAIELDELFWLPNWVSRPRKEFRVSVEEALHARPDGWVSDGNYNSSLGDLVVGRADTLIWLHLPWRVSFWRVFKRCVSRARTREPMWTAENRESWRRSFLARDSILLWSITHHRAVARSVRGRIAHLPATTALIQLRSSRQVEAFLRAVAAARALEPQR